MSKREKWSPSDYTLENQLSDMLKGWAVVADETSVIKESQDGEYGRIFIESDGDRGHERWDKVDGVWTKTHD